MKTAKDNLHRIQEIYSILLRKLLRVPYHFDHLLILVQTSEDFLVYFNKHLIIAKLFLLLNEALNSAGQQSKHILRIRPMEDNLLSRKPTAHSFLKAIHEVYKSCCKD